MGCETLSKLYIPKDVIHIGDTLCGNCTNLSSITVDKNNPIFTDDESNCIINKVSKTLIAGCFTSSIPNYIWLFGNKRRRICK